jgi:hypothetical protein
MRAVKCRDQNDTEPWACGDCGTARLEAGSRCGRSFLEALKSGLLADFRRH